MVHSVRVGDIIEVHGHRFLIEELMLTPGETPKLTVVSPMERLEKWKPPISAVLGLTGLYDEDEDDETE